MLAHKYDHLDWTVIVWDPASGGDHQGSTNRADCDVDAPPASCVTSGGMCYSIALLMSHLQVKLFIASPLGSNHCPVDFSNVVVTEVPVPVPVPGPARCNPQ